MDEETEKFLFLDEEENWLRVLGAGAEAGEEERRLDDYTTSHCENYDYDEYDQTRTTTAMLYKFTHFK